jgi:hypothetical protein
MILEESMEEQPVRKTDRLAVISLCLGILGFITSFPFWIVLWTVYERVDLWLLYPCMISPVFGVVALSTGVDSKKRTIGKNGIAIAGIVLGSLTLLFSLANLIIQIIGFMNIGL